MSAPRGLEGGIVCSLITPFASDESVDFGALGELIDYQVAAGVHGLFLLGTAGEGVLLNSVERREVAEFAADRVRGRVPLAMHCGAADTKTAAELAGHAVQSGVDAVAVVSPYYFSYGEAGLRDHFEKVARASAPAPLYLYDNPERVGYSLGFSMVHDLVREVENICGVKDTGDSIARVTRYSILSDPDVEVYTGNNLIVLPALIMGARGSVSAFASAVPELFVGIYEAWWKGDINTARELQLAAARLQVILDGLPYIGGIKYLLSRRGLPAGGMRGPLPAAGEASSIIDDRVAKAGSVLEPWMTTIN